jgi:hypothetical protein
MLPSMLPKHVTKHVTHQINLLDKNSCVKAGFGERAFPSRLNPAAPCAHDLWVYRCEGGFVRGYWLSVNGYLLFDIRD